VPELDVVELDVELDVELNVESLLLGSFSDCAVLDRIVLQLAILNA